MLNKIVLMGRLTRDPELRRTGSGVPVVAFTLACDRDFGKNENGERETDFIDIVAWRNTAEFVSKYFTKGRMAVAVGRLQIRNWTDKEGNKRRSAEVVAEDVYFGDSKRDSDGAGGQQGGYGYGGSYGGSYGGAPQQSSYPQGGYPQSSYGAPQGGYGAPQGSYNAGPPAGGYPPSSYGPDFADVGDERDIPF